MYNEKLSLKEDPYRTIPKVATATLDVFYVVYSLQPTFDNHLRTTTSTLIKTRQFRSSTMVTYHRISHEIRADELTKSQFILIDNRPCRITSITFSSTSHNTPTLHILGIDITTPSKPQSFFQNHQQTRSLHCRPKAIVSVPEVGYLRGDRLQVGDYVVHGELIGHIKMLTTTNVGSRQQILATALKPLDGLPTTSILWDDEMVTTPKLEVTEFRLLAFLEAQIVEFENENGDSALNVAQVENR